jgi:hypothetical protein
MFPCGVVVCSADDIITTRSSCPDNRQNQNSYYVMIVKILKGIKMKVGAFLGSISEIENG